MAKWLLGAPLALLTLACMPANAAGPSITSLTLIDSANSQSYFSVSGGGSIDLSKVDQNHLSIRAQTSVAVSKVVFNWDNGAYTHPEGSSPYDMCSDAQNNSKQPLPCNVLTQVGPHMLTVTPYDTTTAKAAGVAMTVKITVTEPASTNPPPTTSGSGSHYLYVASAPECMPSGCKSWPATQGYVNVYDLDNNFKLIKTFNLPTTVKGIRAVFHDSTGAHLYITNYGTTNLGDTTTARLLSYNLTNGSVTYDVSYRLAAIDNACITPDDKTIYAAAGENVGSGAYARSWYVITAASGVETSVVNLNSGAVRPHNTQCAPGFVYMTAVDNNGGPASHHSVTVYNTSSHVQTTVGPFTAGTGRIRPFVVDVPHHLVYVNLEDWIGFAVGDTVSGKVLFDKQAPPNYAQPGTTNVVQSHGIEVTPDGNRLYVADPKLSGVEAWDVSGVRSGQPPKYLAFIKTSADPSMGSQPGWLEVSTDGKYIFAQSGEVISTASNTVVAMLSDPLQTDGHGAVNRSRYMTEIDH